MLEQGHDQNQISNVIRSSAKLKLQMDERLVVKMYLYTSNQVFKCHTRERIFEQSCRTF